MQSLSYTRTSFVPRIHNHQIYASLTVLSSLLLRHHDHFVLYSYYDLAIRGLVPTTVLTRIAYCYSICIILPQEHTTLIFVTSSSSSPSSFGIDFTSLTTIDDIKFSLL